MKQIVVRLAFVRYLHNIYYILRPLIESSERLGPGEVEHRAEADSTAS